MPKVKSVEMKVKGVDYAGEIKVDRHGDFSVKRPGTREDWPAHSMTITGKTLGEVEKVWEAAVCDLSLRCGKERRVIIVRYDSNLREGAMRRTFNDRDATLIFTARVAIERTTTISGKEHVTYLPDPTLDDMHAKGQPFPWGFQIDSSDLRDYAESDWCVVAWTQELEDTLVRACKGIQAIIDLFERSFVKPKDLEKIGSSLFAMPQLESKKK